MSGENFAANVTGMEMPNMDATCAAASIGHPVTLPYSTTLITTMRSIQTAIYLIVVLLGIFLNTLVIVLVAKHKKLHTRSFAIALQVVVLDLVLSCTVLTLRPISSIANQWLFGEAMCIITGYIYLTFLLLRALLMLAFVVDRFLTVFYLFTYPKYSTITMLTFSVAIWMFSLGFRTIGFPGVLDCYSFVSTSYLCLHSSRCNADCAVAANINLGIVFGPATIIPIILYIALYVKARRLRKRRQSMTVPPPSDDTNSSNSNKTISKREWKANITFFLLFVAVFALTTPVVSLNLIFAALIRRSGPSPVLYVFSSLLSSISSILVITDPLVILWHGDVKQILHSIKKKIASKLLCNTN